jgi:RNA polymerase sigma-70 factor (ECF subfamily)
MTENQGIIHKVTRIYCDQPDDRKDLFQEILIQLWKSYDTFRDQSKFSTWMYRVAINTAITNFKKEAKHKKKIELGKELYSLADEPYDHQKEDQLKLLYEAIGRLTGIEKSITLLYLEDHSYEEIAEVTGISQNYVRVKMNRIKKKLETYIKQG